MAIKIQKKVDITNEALWFFAAPPKGKEKQWKDNYSAKELAKFATNESGVFTKFITNLVKSQLGQRISASFEGEPEYDTYLPPTKNGPRNHDLCLWNKDLVIGIEAKVNEAFGNSIGEEYNKAELANRQDMIYRIKWLLETLAPNSTLKDSTISNLRYQLFTATAGTLLEAYNRGLSKCIVLVLSFREQTMTPNKKNDEEFKAFVNFFCREHTSNKKCFTVNGKEIECLFIKQEVITNNYTLQ